MRLVPRELRLYIPFDQGSQIVQIVEFPVGCVRDGLIAVEKQFGPKEIAKDPIFASSHLGSKGEFHRKSKIKSSIKKLVKASFFYL